MDNPDLAIVIEADINEADIQALIANIVPEGRDLGYKVATYGNRDEDKREFLNDVSSFANTAGRHMVIGMYEAGGVREHYRVLRWTPTLKFVVRTGWHATGSSLARLT